MRECDVFERTLQFGFTCLVHLRMRVPTHICVLCATQYSAVHVGLATQATKNDDQHRASLHQHDIDGEKISLLRRQHAMVIDI